MRLWGSEPLKLDRKLSGFTSLWSYDRDQSLWHLFNICNMSSFYIFLCIVDNKTINVMKRIFFLILMAMAVAIGYCQLPYRAMLTQQKAWVYEKHHYVSISCDELLTNYDEQIISERYVLDGDTLINGVKYYRLMMSEEEQTPKYYCALREEGTAVYIVENNATDEKLLQDFDVNQFPEYFNDEEPNFGYTDETDVVIVNNKAFLRHNYTPKNEDLNIELTAVEGIGFSDTALVFGMHPRVYSPSQYNDWWTFKQCEENGEILFTAADFYKRNDTNIINSANTEWRKSHNFLHDLQGRPVNDAPIHGIYVKDGRKVIR